MHRYHVLRIKRQHSTQFRERQNQPTSTPPGMYRQPRILSIHWNVESILEVRDLDLGSLAFTADNHVNTARNQEELM